METLGSRLKKLRKENKLTQQQIADAIGVSKTSVIYWEKDENVPKHESLMALAKILKTTPRWLTSGENAPALKDKDFHGASVYDENTPLDDDEVEIPFFEDFSFACGAGAIGEALKSNTQKMRLSKAVLRKLDIDKKNAIATLAAGDSMTPEIKDGNTIHIDLGRKTIKDGKIYAICHGGLFMAKRLYNLPQGGVRVVSDNAIEYPEVVLTAEERKQQEFEVIGWVWQITSIQSW
ncbi:helix-turn-helix transcriptional regulator [Acinetobacter radioresistens]|nr:helix-turn-helix transcriptional regulator [Acinetobacter radioresistens]NTY98603.1 helix-turn-helix transcriptional regulator [Acinetobacter radioresistens]